jgi:hypothetical protein
MGVRGKRYHERIITTYSDGGMLNGRQIIGRHFSDVAAKNAWKRIRRWYGHGTLYGSWRLWQVDHRLGDKIINDTGSYGHKSYGNSY